MQHATVKGRFICDGFVNFVRPYYVKYDLKITIVLNVNPMMSVVRERYFIQHDYQKQRAITAEYTIQSNKDGLTNLIFLSESFLPNLLVMDESRNVLSIMPSEHVSTLFNMYYESSQGYEKDKLKMIISKIQTNELHLIWVVIPEQSKLKKNEIRTIVLNYSSIHIENKEPVLKMRIKNMPYRLYYTLYTPSDFDFEKTKYSYWQNNHKFTTYNKPDSVELFRTYNSRLFRTISNTEFGLEMTYSFQPTPQSTIATKIGLGTLSFLSFGILIAKLITSNSDIQFDLLTKDIEIGILIIGGSLVLPQLTANDSIKSKYSRYYILPIILGALILIWQ